ncbi:MAG: BlaI/MecI/CopY family transcriptional regulator [Vicinamibacterales bacterium]
MAKPPHHALSRREREVMDVLYRRGRATAAEVMAELSGAPTSSTVRTQLRILEAKGAVRHEEEGLRYVYMPAVARQTARRSAVRHVVETFFDGSAERLVAALLGGEAARLSDDELERITEIVATARKERRR